MEAPPELASDTVAAIVQPRPPPRSMGSHQASSSA